MKERPILFSGEMVRAIIEGRKTQTRRVVKPQPVPAPARAAKWDDEQWLWESNSGKTGIFHPDRFKCPYGAAGDEIWLRETWKYSGWSEDGEPFVSYKADGLEQFIEGLNIPDGWQERVSDVWAELSTDVNCSIDGKAADRKWRPSIHMPRWASRIKLEVTGVRVERLQEITAEDALSEGVESTEDCLFLNYSFKTAHPPHGTKIVDEYHRLRKFISPVDSFRTLWQSINSPDSWKENPWVWVVEFSRLEAA